MKPKVGDKIICIDDNSQDEDLGMSGIVLKGTVGLVVGRKYVIKSLDFKNVPKSRFHYEGNQGEIWTKEEFEGVKWYWTYAWIEGEGFSGRINLGYFKKA